MGTETIPSFDKNLERITTREQGVRHLRKILKLDGEFGDFNPTSFEAEIVEDPNIDTDIVIFFRSDADKYATTEEKYDLFLKRYNFENGTIPSYKLRMEEWNGLPYIRVRITE